MFVVASISAGKLLPYQDYLLYKPCGSLRTKAYFQQKSDSSIDSSSRDGFSMATLDEESGVTDDASCLPPACADISAAFDDGAEFSEEPTLHNVSRTKPTGEHISSVSSELSATSTHLTAERTDDVAMLSSSCADDKQMSAENRKRVSEFFSHSRLHHISMWGTEYKAYVTQLQSQVGRNVLMDVLVAYAWFVESWVFISYFGFWI